MREIRLRDGSYWRLETLLADQPKRRAKKRRVSQARTWVWVRCTSGLLEHRLMFAPTWELWGDDVLVRVVETDLARAAPAGRADAAAAMVPAPLPPGPGAARDPDLPPGREG